MYNDNSTYSDTISDISLMLSQSYFSELASLCKDQSRMPPIDFSEPLFRNKHTSLQKLLKNANKTTEKATNFLNKIKSRKVAYANRSKSIAKNATIRKEYIKRGKDACEDKHGPYSSEIFSMFSTHHEKNGPMSSVPFIKPYRQVELSSSFYNGYIIALFYIVLQF